MKLELITGNSEEEAARLLAVSRQAKGGLTLTAEQARTVALAHGDALRRTGRIEWGPSAAEGLLDAFAGSPWLTREIRASSWRTYWPCSTTAGPSCRTVCPTAGCWSECGRPMTGPVRAAWN